MVEEAGEDNMSLSVGSILGLFFMSVGFILFLVGISPLIESSSFSPEIVEVDCFDRFSNKIQDTLCEKETISPIHEAIISFAVGMIFMVMGVTMIAMDFDIYDGNFGRI